MGDEPAVRASNATRRSVPANHDPLQTMADHEQLSLRQAVAWLCDTISVRKRQLTSRARAARPEWLWLA
jgi:hypothetical protein